MGLSRTQEVLLLEMDTYMGVIYYYSEIDKAILKYDNGEQKTINAGTFKKLLKDDMIIKTGFGNSDLGVVEYYDLSVVGNNFCIENNKK